MCDFGLCRVVVAMVVGLGCGSGGEGGCEFVWWLNVLCWWW